MFQPCYTIGWTRLPMYLGTLSLKRAATVRVIGFSKPKPVLGNLFVTRMDVVPFQG